MNYVLLLTLTFQSGGYAPFNVLVNFDESEILDSPDTTASPATTANPSTGENSGVPGGFVGFSLDFTQVDCTT